MAVWEFFRIQNGRGRILFQIQNKYRMLKLMGADFFIAENAWYLQVHAFYFISNTFISNARVKFAKLY